MSKKYQPMLPRLRIAQHHKTIPPKIKQYHLVDDHKLENIVDKLKFQKQLVEMIIPFSQDEAQQSIHQDTINTFSKEEFLRHYSQNKLTVLREKALKGIHPIDKKLYSQQELSKLDQKVQLMNERNPLAEQWHSPFLTSKGQTSAQRITDSKEIDLSASQQIDIPIDNQLLLNENFKGFGLKLRSYFDFDKHGSFDRHQGNPKYLYRGQQIKLIKNKSTSQLDLIKQWNILIDQDKLLPRVVLPRQEGRMQQFGTISSISHYYSIQDFHKKKQKQVISATNQNTPISQISPQFVIKNSRQSNQSKELEFGKTAQMIAEFEEEESRQLTVDVSIHRETFLTYCQIFWDLVRKEDEIVERVIWAFCKGEQFTFSGFKHFFKLLVYGQGSIDEYIKFTYDFLMAQQRDEIPFVELQGLLKLLLIRIDSQLKPDNSLSGQILMDIVNKIHRPQLIQKDTLWQLISEDKIPCTLLVRMVYD